MTEHISFPDHLRITALATSEKLVSNILKTKEGRYPIYIQDAYVINLLSDLLGFSYELLLSKTSGTPLPDGNWTGMVGLLQRGAADLAVGAIALTEEEEQVLKFTHPYLYNEITFVTEKPGSLPKSSAIIHPFTWVTWIAIFTSLVFMPLVLYALLGRRYSCASVFFTVFGNLLENSMTISMKALSVRLLLLFWMTGAFFLIVSYKAVLLAFLTFPSQSGVRDVRDLSAAVTDPSFRCHLNTGTYVHRVLLQSPKEGVRDIAECGNRNPGGYETVLEMLRNTDFKKAVIAGRNFLHEYQTEFFMSDDAFFTFIVAVSTSKTFCCRDALDLAINRIAGAGLFQKVEKDDEFTKVLQSFASFPEESDYESGISLAFGDLLGAFGILIAGLHLAGIILITEILHKNFTAKDT